MSQYIQFPVTGGAQTYATAAALPASAADGSLAVTLDTDTLYVFDAGSMTWLALGAPSAVLSVGVIDSQAPGANGATLNINALIMQSASVTVPGLVNLTTQSFAGNKTFTGSITASNLSGTNTGDVTLGTANGLSLLAQVLSLQLSSTTDTGALSSTDWNTFNNKQNALTLGDLTDVGTDGIVITGGTGAVVGTGTSIAQHVADATHNGYLLQTDWSTFNAKQPAGSYITALTGDVSASGPGSAAATLATVNGNVGSFTLSNITVNAKGLVTAASSTATGNLTDVGTDGITITGGTGAVIGAGTSIDQHVADATHNGYLSSTDWSSFSATSGSAITALTGDATATGPGSAALTLATVNSNVGSFGSSTSIPSFTVNAKGLITAASGNAVIAPASTLTGTTLAANVVNSSLTSVGTITSGTWQGTQIANAYVASYQYPEEKWVACNGGSDITGDGSFQRPWQTLGYASTQVSGNVLIHLTGFFPYDQSAGPITLAPNVALVADYPGFQINQDITISPPAGNAGVTLVNIIHYGVFTWIENTAGLLQFNLLDSDMEGGIVFKQNGAGVSGCFLQAKDTVINGLDVIAGQVTMIGGDIFGALTYEDSGTAYLFAVGLDIASTISLSGGLSAFFGGCLVESGTTLSTTTTGSGTPNIQTDAGSIPASISGPGTITLSSFAQHESFTPLTSANWNTVPTEVKGALDTLAVSGIAKTQSANTVLAGPTTGGAALPTFRSLVAADIPALSPSTISLTDTHILVGNASNVAADVAMSGDASISNTGALTIGNLAVTNAKIANATIDLTAKVTGVLPIANGGTNSSAALNNNRVMTSVAGAIVEAAAITANKALASNASGIPVASTTTDTELGYVAGVTSAIQTQLNAKQSTALTSAHILVGNGSNLATDVAMSGDVTISNTGVTTISAGAVTLTTDVTGVLPEANGGTNQSTYATGDLLYASATNTLSKLSAGTSGYFLQQGASVPSWQPVTATAVDSHVRVYDIGGNGSTNTAIRYFNTTISTAGSDISYNNSSTNGDTWTINTAGVYAISFSDGGLAGAGLGISLNSNQLSTSIFSITAAHRLVTQNPQGANEVECCSWTGYLAVNDVIRAHSDGSTIVTVTTRSNFSIYKVI